MPKVLLLLVDEASDSGQTVVQASDLMVAPQPPYKYEYSPPVGAPALPPLGMCNVHDALSVISKT